MGVLIIDAYEGMCGSVDTKVMDFAGTMDEAVDIALAFATELNITYGEVVVVLGTEEKRVKIENPEYEAALAKMDW